MFAGIPASAAGATCRATPRRFWPRASRRNIHVFPSLPKIIQLEGTRPRRPRFNLKSGCREMPAYSRRHRIERPDPRSRPPQEASIEKDGKRVTTWTPNPRKILCIQPASSAQPISMSYFLSRLLNIGLSKAHVNSGWQPAASRIVSGAPSGKVRVPARLFRSSRSRERTGGNLIIGVDAVAQATCRCIRSRNAPSVSYSSSNPPC